MGTTVQHIQAHTDHTARSMPGRRDGAVQQALLQRLFSLLGSLQLHPEPLLLNLQSLNLRRSLQNDLQ